jgi:hypothetical protein
MASRPPEHVPPTAQERNRFFAINVVRLSGAALILIGILIVNGAIDLPEAVGYVFIPLGLIEVFVMPLVLARRWRSNPE